VSNREAFQEGSYYHVYNRGTEKRPIFMDEADYQRFLIYLLICNSRRDVRFLALKGKSFAELAEWRGEPIVDICVYRLMPNHYHLVIRARKPSDISKFMQKAMTAYTKYFNRRHERDGVLFQGGFKANRVKDERHLLTLIAYVNLNELGKSGEWDAPLSDEEVRAVSTSPYGSLPDYLGVVRTQSLILSKGILPPGFGAWPLATKSDFVEKAPQALPLRPGTPSARTAAPWRLPSRRRRP